MRDDRLIGRDTRTTWIFFIIASIVFIVVVGTRILFDSLFLTSILLLKYWKAILPLSALGLSISHTYLNDGFVTALLISILLLEGFVIAASWGSMEIGLTVLGWGLGGGFVIGIIGYALGAGVQSVTMSPVSEPKNG